MEALRAALHVSAGAVARRGRGYLKLVSFELGGGACVKGAVRKGRMAQALYAACCDGKWGSRGVLPSIISSIQV